MFTKLDDVTRNAAINNKEDKKTDKKADKMPLPSTNNSIYTNLNMLKIVGKVDYIPQTKYWWITEPHERK